MRLLKILHEIYENFCFWFRQPNSITTFYKFGGLILAYPFMIMLDETTNIGDEKEFQLLIRFWSNESNQTTICT